MPYAFDGSGFAVRVDGSLVGALEWHVHAVVAYPQPEDLARTPRAYADARSALVLGILREARRGEILGAKTVRVRIEGDPVVGGDFVMNRNGAPPRLGGEPPVL